MVLLIVLAPMTVGGWYVWNLTNTISDAQEHSYVPLPGDDAVGGGGDPSQFDVAKGVFSAGTGIHAGDPAEIWPDQEAITILVLGVDTRPDGNEMNADVIILARLNMKDHTLYSVSIPRDLYVDIPGHGKDKINAAYHYGVEEDPDSRVGGVSKMRDTIEQNFDVKIDDYVLIDFEGFKNVVDAVGGVDINVPTTIEDVDYPTEDYGTKTVTFRQGMMHMDGETALAYARTRHSDSDDQRRERQMLVLRALFDKGNDLGTITKVAPLIRALGDAAQTSFTWEQQLALANVALNMSDANIHMLNLGEPYITPGTADDGAWIYVGDIPAISQYINQVLSGNPPADATQ